MKQESEYFAAYGVFFDPKFREELFGHSIDADPILVPGFELRIVGSEIFPTGLATALGPSFRMWACYPNQSAYLNVLPIKLSGARKAIINELNFDDLVFDYRRLKVNINEKDVDLLLACLNTDVGRKITQDQFAPILMRDFDDCATGRMYKIATELRQKYQDDCFDYKLGGSNVC